MTIQRRGATAPAAITAGGTISVPASVASGDVMFMAFSAPASQPYENTVPDGWHHFGQALAFDLQWLIIYYRKSGGSEPATYTTGFSQTVSGAMFVVYSDIAAAINIDAIAQDVRATSTSIVFPSVTASAAGMLLNFATLDSSFSSTPPGGSTEEWDGPTSTTGRMYLMYSTISGAGATGTKTATSSVSQSCEVVSIALTEATFVYPLGPVFRERVAAGEATGTSKTITAPANLKVGDLMILHVGFSASSPSFTVTGGAVTWTAITGGEITGSNSIHTLSGVAAAGDIGATYTISWSGSKTINAALSAYYSPTGYSLSIEANNSQTNASVANVPFPTITTLANDALVLWMSSSNVVTTPSWDTTATHGMGNYANGTNIKVSGFSEYVAANGATGTRTATVAGATTNSKVVVLSLVENITVAAPTGLNASTVSSSQINLTWTDTSSNESSFSLERSPDNSTWAEIATPAANSTSYSNTSLAEHTVYYYRIRSLNIVTYSSYSNTSNATTSLVAPSGLTATAASASQINLAWVDNSSAEDSYKVEQSPTGAGSWAIIATTAANATSHNVTTGLSANTVYYFRVRAAAGSDFSSYTSNASDTTWPAAPTNLVATPKLSTKITLTWTAVSGSITGYRVERSLTGVGSWSEIGTPSSATLDDTARSVSTTYFYRVRAYRSAINGAYSSNASAATYAALTTPTTLAATVINPTAVRLTWNDLDIGVTGYNLERSDDNGDTFTEISTPSSPPYTDEDLDESTVYIYKIRARRTG